jgi:isoamylase
VLALRERQERNFLATLILSQGVPMLLGGDEFGRTQRGNNNAWCQDNEISWLAWDHAPWQRDLHDFTSRLLALRREHPIFRRSRFFTGTVPDEPLPDVWWFRADGRRMTQRDWKRGDAHALGVFLNGEKLDDTDMRGVPIRDRSFLILFNAWHEDVQFRLPNASYGRTWSLVVASGEPQLERGGWQRSARDSVNVDARSLLVLEGPPVPPSEPTEEAPP